MELRTKNIGSVDYTLALWGFTEGVKAKKAILGALAPFLGGLDKDISSVLPQAIESFDLGLIELLCSSLKAKGPMNEPYDLSRQNDRDRLWTGKYFEAYKVLLWVIRENFEDFFMQIKEEGGEIFKELLEKVHLE